MGLLSAQHRAALEVVSVFFSFIIGQNYEETWPDPCFNTQIHADVKLPSFREERLSE